MNKRIRKVRSDKITFCPRDIEKIEKMAGIGLSIKQISSIFNISSDTLQRRAKENDFNLTAALTKGKSQLEARLGHKAVELALEGNTSMLKYVLGCKFSWTKKQQIIVEEQKPNDNERGKAAFQKTLDDLTREELEEIEILTQQFMSFEEKVEKRLKLKKDDGNIQGNSQVTQL